MSTCTLVSSIITPAHAFDLSIVAEGVENQPQVDHLLRAGCDESQGYFDSRPLPAPQLEAWLVRSQRADSLGTGRRSRADR